MSTQYNDAKELLEKVEGDLKAFKEGAEGKLLANLRGSLLRGEGSVEQRKAWKDETERLEAEEKELKARRIKWEDQVAMLQTAAQSGNDFVTRRWEVEQ